MKQTTEALSETQKKQCRFLLVLPVLILPFLTFLLWTLGLIGGSEAKAATAGGLNTQLPDAKLKENKSWNKLSFYEQADKDSLKYKEAVKDDPFFQQHKDTSSTFAARDTASLAYNPLPPGYDDVNEYKVAQKLAQLNSVLNTNPKEDKIGLTQPIASRTSSIPSNEVNRLAQMLETMNQPDSEADPETQQLNGMMDKILDIQHPERVNDRIQQESEKSKKQVFPVVSEATQYVPSLLQAASREKIKNSINRKQTSNAFYSLTSDTIQPASPKGVRAEIQETQTFVSGSSVKLVLASNIYVNGILIPQGTFLYGTSSQNEERLNIVISSIRYQNTIFPVSLSVYDLDGLEGIHIPGSVSRDVAKQSGSEALNNIGLSSFDPSLPAQAASAGIAAAKSLINKKVKQVKLAIRAGYQVLLNDGNHQQ